MFPYVAFYLIGILSLVEHDWFESNKDALDRSLNSLLENYLYIS